MPIYEIVWAKNFRQQRKKFKNQPEVLDEIDKVIELLAKGKTLPQKYKDHALKGNYKDFRECHIKPDLLLFYRYFENVLELYVAGLDNHNNSYD